MSGLAHMQSCVCKWYHWGSQAPQENLFFIPRSSTLSVPTPILCFKDGFQSNFYTSKYLHIYVLINHNDALSYVRHYAGH